MMRTRRTMVWCAVVAVLVGGSVAWSAVIIDTVTVGDPGNAHGFYGYGGVDYDYAIGKYEVTAGQYTVFLNAVAGVDAYGLYNTQMWTNNQGCKIQRTGSGTVGNPYQYQVASEWANRPVNYVSWGDAARFANWMHNGQPTGAQVAQTTEDGAYALNGATSDAALLAVSREADWLWAIPTENEWYKAAYYDPFGPEYFTYPTGTHDQPSNALVDPDPGNTATYNDTTIGSPYYRTEVGAHENSASPYGTFDQGGNVWEWNEEPVNATSRGLRGGEYGGSETYMKWGSRNWNAATSEREHQGFRLVNVPEPMSMTILSLGGTCLLYRRKR